jgi:hypothetical protein
MQKIPKIPAITAALLATTSMVSAQPKAEFPLARFTLAASVSEISETTTEHLTSVDINGDGFGDYDTPQAAEAATGNRGVGVVGGCGDCNGPNVAGTANPDPVATTDSNDGPDGGGKIVCTAMNAAYGFGSYRQAIWLAHAQQNMTQYHQTGYHLLALPLIRIAYGAGTHSGYPCRDARFCAPAFRADVPRCIRTALLYQRLGSRRARSSRNQRSSGHRSCDEPTRSITDV